MNPIIQRVVVGWAVALSLLTCKKKEAQKKEEITLEISGHVDEPEHKPLSTLIHLEHTVINEAKIQTEPVQRGKIATILTLSGEIVADPDRSAQITASLAGRIERIISLKEGKVVKRGEMLGMIRTPEAAKLGASFLTTSKKAAAARSNVERLEALNQMKLIPDQELITARAEAEALEADQHSAEEQLQTVGISPEKVGSLIPLFAPISGTIVARNAVLGQPVTPNESIATLVDLNEVWFVGRVFEKDLEKIRINAPAEIELNAYPRERFEGTIEYLEKRIDPSVRTIQARIRLTNRRDLLRIGLFGVAHVTLLEEGNRPRTLVIPRQAITDVGGSPVVFVQQPDGDFQLHSIVTGDEAAGKVEVISGLREGEMLVTNGVFLLKSAVLKGSMKEED
ncbi:efflux RND transporter periplasmic adaptor subunit [Pajaroellobacter abortibovis]|uniref:Uncharacterized protein n=1 Tax=Pajaroellobacter abortibovis TaxID=1882918 RepID=A0A1L6MX82_9BACT|nr:efflux RND transporter periplasmic adaptor subunit [Pajaroellobacter abortibovis]APS00183.1 hypothetical protein BCY86_05435 [Pajaroellobacter abortibovis]